LSPIYGCFCPDNKPGKRKKCDDIFDSINANPCIDIRFFISEKSFHDIKKYSVFWIDWYKSSLINFDVQNQTEKWSRTTASVMYSLWTDNQHSVEQSIATPVYVQSKHGPQNTKIDLVFESTCHIALEKCEKTISCSRFLEQVKRMCEPNAACDKQKCMRAIQEMYREISHNQSLDIAFCICK
jgi:hypothetical protein